MLISVAHVLVPPEIRDDVSSSSIVSVSESMDATLICRAHGTPKPIIKWRREDSKPIVINSKETGNKITDIKITSN